MVVGCLAVVGVVVVWLYGFVTNLYFSLLVFSYVIVCVCFVLCVAWFSLWVVWCLVFAVSCFMIAVCLLFVVCCLVFVVACVFVVCCLSCDDCWWLLLLNCRCLHALFTFVLRPSVLHVRNSVLGVWCALFMHIVCYML